MKRILPILLLLAFTPVAGAAMDGPAPQRRDLLAQAQWQLQDVSPSQSSTSGWSPLSTSSHRWLLEWQGPGRAPLAEGMSWRGERAGLLECPASELGAWLAAQPEWRLTGERRLEPCLDLALPLTGTNLAHLGAIGLDQALQGQGVLIGIVDTGIDLQHRDFWDQGRCRVLEVWDQELNRFYTAAQIEAGQSGPRDADGHGTHVAGIAAGNGASAPGDAAGGPFVGHAPQADLLVVASSLLEADILRAAEWIFQTALELGRPCVLNLSLETHLGAHDGNSLFENELEALSGPGRLIVCAAGNSADDGRHFAAEYQAPLKRIGFSSLQGNDVYLDLWLHSDARPQVELLLPDGSIRTAGGGAATQSGWRISLPEPELEDGRWHLLLQLNDGAADEAFELRLSQDTVASRSLHAWAYGLEFAEPASGHTVGIPATGDSMLVAGSLVHRGSWTDETGNSWYYPGETVGARSSFSAIGPRVDGLPLPHVLLPGQGMFSSMSSELATNPDLVQRRHSDGRHILLQGTSMAAPALAGLMALGLERDPRLGPSAAMQLLRESGSEPWTPERGVGVPDAAVLLAAIEVWFLEAGTVPGLDAIELRWRLATALPGGEQRIYRSTDGESLQLIGRLEATAGSWSWLDEEPATQGPVEYRLELRDAEEQVIAQWNSGPVTTLVLEGMELLALGPNPWVAGPLRLELLLSEATAPGWSLHDLSGATLLEGRWPRLERGRHELWIAPRQALPSGQTFLRLRGAGDETAHKLIVLRP